MTPETSDLIDRWLAVRAAGYLTHSAAANQLGIPTLSLRRAITTAQTAGDPRIPANLRDTIAPSYEQISNSPTMDVPVRYSVGERRAAVRYTASRATGRDDLTQLLDALGLQAFEGKDAPDVMGSTGVIWVCSICHTPTESEPCETHQPRAYEAIT